MTATKYQIVRKDIMGSMWYRVISWEGDNLTIHGEFGWLRDARAYIKAQEVTA